MLVHSFVFSLLVDNHSYQIAHLAAGVVPSLPHVVMELVELEVVVGVSLDAAVVDVDVVGVGALEEVEIVVAGLDAVDLDFAVLAQAALDL